jgi:hypothetical protein
VTHGHARRGHRSPTYISYISMRARCQRPGHPKYADYGGRGITICDRWLERDGFVNFLADVGERPAEMTLDRINVNGNYEPGNVRWATLIQQRWNRRDMANVSQNGQFAEPANAPIRETAASMPF